MLNNIVATVHKSKKKVSKEIGFLDRALIYKTIQNNRHLIRTKSWILRELKIKVIEVF
tara:strand:- start:1591 stop:1764 length:174 start_codon:yes stop_codon:yes gene_type:complete